MADKKDRSKEKNVRVQFPKDASAEEIVDAIDRVQNEWAKQHPQKAHELYPTVYDKDGNRIDGQ
jgi:hypothetical protein